jgi:4-hydroxy-3-polyprenylbenzoate decarboxylase
MPQSKNPEARKLTIATTGASGSIFLKQMLLTLEADRRVAEVNFVASGNSLRVMAEELRGPQHASFSARAGVELRDRQNLVGQLLGRESKKFRQHSNTDIGANIASGSYPVDAMVVIPCSMGTLAKIANGIASELIGRAADVCLKERRPLVLCVRETPLNRIHLRNMLLANDAGATIYPLIPTFYNQPASLEEMARAFVNRVLQHIGLPQPGAYTWKG